jgi:hypothetical protein
MRITLAETSRRNANPDPHGEAPLGHRDHFSRIAWHLLFVICSNQGRFAVSSRLGLPGAYTIFAACVVASASPPM